MGLLDGLRLRAEGEIAQFVRKFEKESAVVSTDNLESHGTKGGFQEFEDETTGSIKLKTQDDLKLDEDIF